MRIRLLHLWEQLRSSYWFIPALMTGSAIVLAFVMLVVDERVSAIPFWAFRWLYRGGMDGAQAVLSTIAGSMITVAGVTFSVVIEGKALLRLARLKEQELRGASPLPGSARTSRRATPRCWKRSPLGSGRPPSFPARGGGWSTIRRNGVDAGTTGGGEDHPGKQSVACLLSRRPVE